MSAAKSRSLLGVSIVHPGGRERLRDAAIAPRLPDHMGIWSDGGDIVWLPLALYPNRLGAFRFAREEWDASPRDVYVTRVWMRFDTDDPEERWVECTSDEPGNEPGAFLCWRLGAA